ncbi:MAG: hypothetical protein LUG18_01805 [Candidatus Azobacteroides sp.]|nr:hypothetical protein [Candidatus Azobacteroides sp.]
MTKKLLAFVFPVFFIHAAFGQLSEESGNWEKEDYKGRVKTVVEVAYVIDNGGEKDKYSDQQITAQEEIIKNFDRAGVLMDQTLISHTGGGAKKWNFVYDSQKRLVEENIYNDTSLEETVSYKYEGDKIVEKAWYKGQNRALQKKWYYNYNNRGQLVNEYWTDPSGKVAWKCTYVYDMPGNMIEKAWYVNDRLTTKWSCKYDIYGNVIENAEYVNGLLKEVTINSYDKKHKMVESRIFKDGELDIRKVYSYNKDGNLKMEWWYDAAGKQIHRRNYDYDKGQRLISSFTWDTKGNLLDKLHWTYDGEGNWFQRIEYEKHVPKYTIKRNISYY